MNFRHIALAILMAPTIAGCAPYLPLEGVVIDTTSGKPVPGAFVITTWTMHGGSLVDSSTSCTFDVVKADGQGRYRFPAGLFGGGDQVISAYKAGYDLDISAGFKDGRFPLRPFTGTADQRVQSFTGYRSLMGCSSSKDTFGLLRPMYADIDLELAQFVSKGLISSGQRWSFERALQQLEKFVEEERKQAGETWEPPTPRLFESGEELDKWVQGYYRNPKPVAGRLGAAVTAISEYQRLDQLSPNTALYVGFIAGVLARTPSAAGELVKHLGALLAPEQAILGRGIWYSGLPESPGLLDALGPAMREGERSIDARIFGSAPSGTARRLVDIPLDEGPWVLSALRGQFLATGDDAPILRMISILRPPDEQRWGPEQMLAHSAAGSLVGFAYEHPRVLDICRKQRAIQPQPISQVLASVIAQVEGELKARDESARRRVVR